ncbi:hypothetical protein L6164_008571 [Bauhinia variegata]|uniref:Uncharacterized protein n=1 Tax=Bauhinia variegata TaxID=167791 RepID=A0ACB9PG13_BAUVA|nr:hypothetical protein L6164_008571 [Bauhinia variegata]
MDEYFTLCIHHGGKFIPGPPRKYEGGWVDHVNYVDPDRFSLTVIAGLLKDIGYAGVESCSYVLLGQNIDNGLVMLIIDDDAMEMVSKYKGQAEIDIYLEHPIDTPTYVDSEVEGLQHIFDNIYPQVDHRYCTRHIWANLSKSHKVWEFLAGIPPRFWTRAAFQTYPKNWNVTNNMCKQFNSVLVPFRGKSIITMLEEIKNYIAKRRIECRQKMSKYQGPITPSAQRKLELAKTHSRWWIAKWAGNADEAIYQVAKQPEKYVVNIKERTCTCREWDLCGIPCEHAVTALAHLCAKPEDYVSTFYREDRTRSPIASNIYKANGKTKGKRKPKQHEVVNPYKLKRRMSACKCTKCGAEGHNTCTCKGLPKDKGARSEGTTTRKNSKKKTIANETNMSQLDAIIVGPSQESTRSSITGTRHVGSGAGPSSRHI